MSYTYKTNRSPNSNAQLHFDPEEECKVEQHHKDACDIRNILTSILKSGDLSPIIGQRDGEEVDLTLIPSFEEAHAIVCQGNNVWESLSVDIRKKFNNSQHEFINFMSNPNNRDEIANLGFDASYLPAAPAATSTEPTPSSPSGANETPQESE